MPYNSPLRPDREKETDPEWIEASFRFTRKRVSCTVSTPSSYVTTTHAHTDFGEKWEARLEIEGVSYLVRLESWPLKKENA